MTNDLSSSQEDDPVNGTTPDTTAAIEATITALAPSSSLDNHVTINKPSTPIPPQQPAPRPSSLKAQQPSSTTHHKHPPSEHFSLKAWIRQAPWKQYFKDGCRLIVKSPLNFFIFFCCLSVVVWGAFLVLLLGNLVKLKDDATQKIWIEVASQVLNGFFTLANVPVHPKRLLGFVRGFKVWREDKAIRQEFVNTFLKEHISSHDQNKEQELLDRLDYYRCFPTYGQDRLQDTIVQGTQRRARSASGADAAVVVARSKSASRSRSRSRSRSLSGSHDPHSVGLYRNIPREDISSDSGNAPTSSTTIGSQQQEEGNVRVDIREEDLNELLTEETERVVHSVVLPFLPFPLGGPVPADDDFERNNSTSMGVLEQGIARTNSRPRIGPQRGSSATLSRIAINRTAPRTRARTMTLSMTRDSPSGSVSPSSTFVFHNERVSRPPGCGYQPVPAESTDQDNSSESPELTTGSSKKHPPKPVPMPAALTQQQMEWVDKRQAGLLERQQQLQRAWPWYNYTIPQGIEPVDFFENAEDSIRPVVDDQIPIMLVSLPVKLLVQPSRFCLIVGSFNLNSMIQEVLCGLMWGMNYLVRPGWAVGTGMALGCLAAIVPSVLIMLQESAMSRVRVVSTTEEVIQKAIDDKGPL
ncbi:hypothetical protein BGZ92_009828 [Podila epicladia]|nr:hypothetical protein BGZ92_009828 [Podila epicladia]